MFKHSVIDFIELNPNERKKYRLAIDNHCSYNPQSAELVEKNEPNYQKQIENPRDCEIKHACCYHCLK